MKRGRGLLLLALAGNVACAGNAGNAAPPGTSAPPSPRVDRYGMSLYLAGDEDIAGFLRTTPVLVSRFSTAERDPGAAPVWEVRLVYPSINEAGRSPMFSHRATVRVADGAALDPGTIDPASTMLVLVPTSGARYELIGTAPRGPDEPFDWFDDKPEYHRGGSR